MAELATTIMSSKGQVVIPEKIRTNLRLEQGTEFVVVSNGDALILKPISAPSAQQFEALLDKAHQEAKKAGLKKSELQNSIRDIRREK